MDEQKQQKPNIHPLTPREEQPPKPRRKLPRFVVRTLAALVVVAAALSLAAAVAFRDSLNLDSIKRWFT